MFGVLARNPRTSRLNAGVLAVTFLALAFPAIGTAADCTIETHGQAAYTRVKEKIVEKMFKFEQFQFVPYEDIDVSVSSGCVFELHGNFSHKKKNNLIRKVFDAKLKPKSGAAHGMKMLKLQISNR
jgi:hypothetical protein